MRATQHIFRIRREYNRWVGDETLEDYALRFTAKKARHWSIDRVAKTALGATAFLALEAIAATLTLSYGFANAFAAMLAVGLVIVVTGSPIAYAAARHGLDIDLLTRGGGFGYLGSTITSFIYASFTYIFFAIEAAILASALRALLGIPLPLAYVICALAVIPIVTHGIKAISKFQVGTQGLWLLLQFAALSAVAVYEFGQFGDWLRYAPVSEPGVESGGFDLALFGASAAVLFALVPQIGEQVDYLRFLPPKTKANGRRWWFWLAMAGPGWIGIGLLKMLFGSFLAVVAIRAGSGTEQAADPTYMYQMAFGYITQSPGAALVLAGLMVLLSQMKINVTNAYAGSIAWSNFFSRLTHSHPGRVVWLVFNVVIALILMELGIHRALESILGLFAIVALAWLGSLAADLMINKPLGLSPAHVEFKRGHLYDINPVGVGSMFLGSVVGVAAYLGVWGEVASHLAHFLTLGLCFLAVPAFAVLTGGRYYLARESAQIDTLLEVVKLTSSEPDSAPQHGVLRCCVCENAFEREDMIYCPAYQGAICSLCCSLDSRCMDSCKPGARVSDQLAAVFRFILPELVLRAINPRLARFVGVLSAAALVLAAVLGLISFQMQPANAAEAALLKESMVALFFVLLIVCGVIGWLFLLTHESRVVAQQESDRQTRRLIEEIEAHEQTDLQLQAAKEQAERANSAKSRYLTGISHELRTPLHAILGYAQLLSENPEIPERHRPALQTIRRSGEYLADLIEGLLDISKIEAGRLDIYRNTLDLPDLIEQLSQVFRDMAEEKGITFQCHVRGALPRYVVTDTKRLRQILINLLSNAVKYTERGRIEFRVKYRSEVAEFSVVDTGVGIHQRDLQRILDPFERVCGPGVPNVAGTGLGLTIVRLLTEVMGGDLQISSTPGVGSCFTVSLMLSRTSGPEEDNPATHDCITGYEGPRRVVMVVDDEPVHRGLMAEILTPLGFFVVEAADAESCLARLDSISPDIFLLDVSMPGMDGITLSEMLRQRGLSQPIVMISANARERHGSELEPSAHDGYLVKPIKNAQLIDLLSQLLRLKWTHDAEQAAHSSLPASLHDGRPTPALDKGTELDPRKLTEHGLVRELVAYAQIGYRKGVDEKLKEIAAEQLMSDAALGKLQKLASGMNFDQLVTNLVHDD